MQSLQNHRHVIWLVYAGWILLCAALFIALGSADDPAIPDDHITEHAVISRAEQTLSAGGFASWEPVHAAWSAPGELGPEGRWVILFEPPGEFRLKDAVVVELSGTGTPLRIRHPERR